jgi:hypothetical protein
MITKFLSVYNVNCGRRGYRTLAHGHRADYGCRLLCSTDLSLPCENLRTSRLAGWCKKNKLSNDKIIMEAGLTAGFVFGQNKIICYGNID